MCKTLFKWLWRQTSISIGPPWETWKGARLPRPLRDGWKGLWRWGVSLYGSSVKGTWREGSLAGNSGGWVRLWSWASLSIGAPLWNLEGGSSTGDFERWMKGTLGMERFSLKRLSVKCLCGGLLYWGSWKICQERLWIRTSLSLGAPLGNLEGISLPKLLREKDSISGFLSWTQRTLIFWVWEPSETLVKGQGSLELISDYGAQRTPL